MSAGTALDKGAIALGLLLPLQRGAGDGIRRGARAQLDAVREARSQYPLAMLSRDHDVVCTQAVDPAEIAATLEASGLNDRLVRERYRVGSVFEVSRQLYDLVPRRPAPAPNLDPWKLPLSRHLGRGVLYALPILPYVAALRLFHASTAALVTLLVGNVVAMALTQAISHVAYLLKGQGAPSSSASFLRSALMGTVGVAAGLSFGAATTHLLPLGAATMAGTQLVYVVAATAIMVLERDRLLLLALVPVIALSVTVFSVSSVAAHTAVLAIVLGACVAIVVGCAWWQLQRAAKATTSGRGVRVELRDVRSAALQGGYGAITAGLLMFAVLDVVRSGDPRGVNSLVGVGMLPLVLSLGICESHLYGFRSDCTALLRKVFDAYEFARGTRRVLATRGLRYAAALAVLTSAVVMPLWVAGDLDAVLALRHLGYAELGIALLGATLLVSCGLAARALVILTVGLVVDLLVRAGFGTHLLDLTIAHAIVFAVLAFGLWAAATTALTSPIRHR